MSEKSIHITTQEDLDEAAGYASEAARLSTITSIGSRFADKSNARLEVKDENGIKVESDTINDLYDGHVSVEVGTRIVDSQGKHPEQGTYDALAHYRTTSFTRIGHNGPVYNHSARDVSVVRGAYNNKMHKFEKGVVEKLTGTRADRAREIIMRRAARKVGDAAMQEILEKKYK